MDKDTLDKAVFPDSVFVTGQEIDLTPLSTEQKEFYKHLLCEILDRYKDSNQARLVYGIAGPTGSGKSVITEIFKALAESVDLPFRFEILGIDAFHFDNSYLNSKKDDDGNILKNMKGRYDTYDVEKIISALYQFKSGNDEVSLPEYSRKTHNPIKNFKTITEPDALLLFEGLWIFSDLDGWDRMSSLLDYRIFIDAEKEAVKENVIARHMKGGKTRVEAEHYYETVDAVNFDLVMKSRDTADDVISPYYSDQ